MVSAQPDVLAVLRAAPPDLVRELDEALSTLDRAQARAVPLSECVEPQRTADGAMTFPHWRYDESVTYALLIIGRVTRVQVSAADPGPDHAYDPADLPALPLDEVARRLVRLHRYERFSEGSIAAAIEADWFVPAVRRLRAAMPAGD